MNKLNNFKGGVTFHKQRKKYVANFFNPLTNTQEYIGIYENEEDAYEHFKRKQIDFYNNHSYLLPKFIVIDNNTRMFVVSIKYKIKSKWNTLYLGSFSLMQQAEQAKKDFISNLL